MTTSKWFAALLAVTVVAATVTLAQRYYDRREEPYWEPDKEFTDDVFTFGRIEYSSGWGGGFGGGYDGGFRQRRGGRRGGRGWGGGRGGGRWATDYPDSDLNFSYRLHQLSAMEVNPDGVVLRLTDPELFDYPFIYIVEPG